MQNVEPPTAPPLVSCTGITTVDTIFGVDALPTGDGKWSAEWLREVGGGVAANAAVAVARLGGRSRFVGCVGTDQRGIAARQGLNCEGVDVSGMHQIEHRPTPTSAVMVDRAGSRMIVNHVADDFFELADPSWAADVSGSDAVLVDLRWERGAEETLAAARRAGIPSVVDVDRPIDLDSAILRHATHLVCSADALATMTGVPRPGEALLRLKLRVPGWVAVTLGEHGVLWFEDHTIHHTPSHQIDVVDTLGAGDTFHGAFALALAEGQTEREAIDFANAAAALKCTQKGGRAGMPSRDAVLAFREPRPRSST